MTTSTRRTSARSASADKSPDYSHQKSKQATQHNGGSGTGKKRKADDTENGSAATAAKKERKTQTILDDYGAESTEDDAHAKQNGEKEEETSENEEIEDREKQAEEGLKDKEMQDAADEFESKHKQSGDGDGTDKKEGKAKGKEQAEQNTHRAKNGAKENGNAKEEEEEDDDDDDEQKEKEDNNKKVGEKQTKADQDHQAKQKNDPKTNACSSQDKSNNGAVTVSEERKEAMPSNILEKGVIYFFVRGRVGVDDPQGVKDIARSYIVLRPLPHGTKLGDGPIPDLQNNRLCALPKKVLPKGHNDVFMTFVEKANVTIEQLKADFMQGSTYTTQTTGVRHTPNVTPVGEGVYAITSTGRSSHLAYILTIPSELGDVQTELGLAEKGSFVVSVKNPESSSSANASLPEPAEFPKELMEHFRGRAWAPLQPQHLDYPNCQFLLIGDGHGRLGKAVEPMEKDEKKEEKETPEQEMEKLHDEDEERVQGLNEDDAVFEDLGVSQKEYPKVPTTW